MLVDRHHHHPGRPARPDHELFSARSTDRDRLRLRASADTHHEAVDLHLDDATWGRKAAVWLPL